MKYKNKHQIKKIKKGRTKTNNRNLIKQTRNQMNNNNEMC